MIGLANQEMGATDEAMKRLPVAEGSRPHRDIARQDIRIGGEFDIEDRHAGLGDTGRPMRGFRATTG